MYGNNTLYTPILTTQLYVIVYAISIIIKTIEWYMQLRGESDFLT